MVDYYGNEWMATYEARMEGDTVTLPYSIQPSGWRTTNKWRATKFPIILTVGYAAINTNDFYVWYPQEEFVLTNISFLNNGFLTCDSNSTISFGTTDNNTIWIQTMDQTAIETTSVNVPFEGRNQSSMLIDKCWKMRSMWATNNSIGVEDFTANGFYNYIRGYKTGNDCTAGSATVIIDGYYPQYIWNGY
jgi:hypothetical protein